MTNNTSLNKNDLAKDLASQGAIEIVKKLAPNPIDIIGIGTGSTVAFFIKRLADAFNSGYIQARPVCTSSLATIDLCQSLGINIFPAIPRDGLKIVVDGADEIDLKSHGIIKGGGAASLAEKDIARASLRCGGNFVIIAEKSKCSEKLGSIYTYGVPVHIRPETRLITQHALEVEFSAKAYLRNAVVRNGLSEKLEVINGKSGCYGNLYTRENDFIVDVRFDGAEIPLDFNERALKLPGVVGTGLFANEDSPNIVITADSEAYTIINW